MKLLSAALVLDIVLAVAIWTGPSMWWASVVFFLALAAIALWALTRKGLDGEEGGPDLVIDDEGVWDRRACGRKISWRDIRSVRIVGGDEPCMALRLNNEERYIAAPALPPRPRGQGGAAGVRAEDRRPGPAMPPTPWLALARGSARLLAARACLSPALLDAQRVRDRGRFRKMRKMGSVPI